MSATVNQYLFELIKSLSKHEKRYFKLYSSRHTIGDQNNYVRLFDAIDQQEAYNEYALMQKFENESFVNRFSIAKARLYSSILKSLDLYHAESSINSQLKQELHFAEILFKKSLYSQCKRVLLSAKKTANKYEKHAALLEISKWEKELIEKDNYAGKTESHLNAMMQGDFLLLEKIKNHSEYWKLKSTLFQLLNKRGNARNQEELSNFKNLIDNTLLKTEKKALSTETRYLYYHTYSAYYFGIGDYKKCYDNLIKNVHLIESKPEIFQEEPNIYFSVLTNLIYIGSQLKEYDQVFDYLQKLRDIPKTLDTRNNEDLEIKLFSSANSLELALQIQLGEFGKALELIPTIETGLKKFNEKLSTVRKADFYLNIAVVYFALNEYSSSLKWINKLLNEISIEDSENIYCVAQMLNLIVHIELENNDLIPYAFKSAHRFLSSRNRVYKFETAFLNFIGKVLKTGNRTEQQSLYEKLHSDLLELKEDNFEKTVFENFDFVRWTESKIKKVPFKELIQEKTLR